jgi:heme A synthase
MWLHRFAVATAVATYALLIVGGLVHGTGSSLACPDWPLCHGSFFPRMEHGVEFEHTHRLVALAVGTCTLVLSVLLLRDARYRALRPPAIAAPIMVLGQAVLGGLTVLLKLPLLITLSHLTLSMCFFSVTVILAIRTRQPSSPGGPARGGGWDLRASVGATAIAVLGQILLGGLVRHSMSGLACTTFPFCFGNVWPPDSSSEQIHMLHRFGAVVVGTLVVASSMVVYRRNKEVRAVRALSLLGPVLVFVQITLGVLSVTSLLHLFTVTAHLAVGALVLADMVALWTLLPQEERRPSPSRDPSHEAVPA